MNGDREAGLTGVSLPDLRSLLRAVETGQVTSPLRGSALLAIGLGHVADDVLPLESLDRSGISAALRVAIAERERRTAPSVELVWTGPEAVTSGARDTAVVVRELFAGAKRSVLVGSFSFDHGAEILRPLHQGMKERGVTATLFLNFDRAEREEPDIAVYASKKLEGFLAENWPFGPPWPQLYYYPLAIRSHAVVSLHAKCVIVDGRRTLVTSANLTDRGQTRNIEAGLLVDDPALASRLEAQWRGLVASGLLLAWNQ